MALGSAGALVAATLIAGTVAAPAASADSRPGQDREARGVAIAAARAAKAGIDWRDCPEDWGLDKPIQCGWVTVPLDYAHPDGKQIKLAVDRVRSTGTPQERQGALIYNPGGPGGSGLRFPTRVTTNNKVWANVAKAYDFVGFDPRGVGHSAPISCMDPQEYVKAPKMDPVPDSEADKLAQRKLAREYADGCLERTGRAMLQQMTTPNTARDLDVIRAALGEEKLNYLGVSYGTYLGAVYGTLFPSHVRRMVVDSVVNPDRDNIWYQANLNQDIAFETRWKDWEDWVAANDATYHLGTTRDAVQAKWLELRATAKKHPIGGVVGPAELLGFFQSAPYYDSSWASVATVFSKYVAGDTQALVDAAAPDMSDIAGNISEENGNAVYTAVECTDAKWPTNWRTWDRDHTRLHAAYPFLTWSNAWMNLPCATWPVKQQTPVEVRTGKGLPPVLIVQSTRDAATPYQGAVELHKRFKGSRLITEKNAGSHGVTGLVNPCINDRVDTYLLTGRVDRTDVTCAPHATPQP
ncbi:MULTISPECIES: alpha/beta hydrolase [Streptomyces]|jgi:pimeloyl-ACP methyl ester carboxylesterase|uniref:Alpha/beta hydrolase n=1 Tax=Streptomyces thermoviolaceus subsp. thermoviolaceus TaxID=66860 RepID=A0ABX0YQH4_STRTL|nr:alpha/beta hydrolase [Streptomyces thermoviolaceus]MCM3262755.1 alpha/beta hydrolase [Streptomyces thermoviolaceus]NJP14815.1 alpha/beta hydrolase [Streptomyces thermoviolaceus subsp. thermoviolaceus]